MVSFRCIFVVVVVVVVPGVMIDSAFVSHVRSAGSLRPAAVHGLLYKRGPSLTTLGSGSQCCCFVLSFFVRRARAHTTVDTLAERINFGLAFL